MEWQQVFTIVGSNVAVFLTVIGANLAMFMWSRSEDRHDQSEMRLIMKSIQDEIVDFHGRLCAIEEKNKGRK